MGECGVEPGLVRVEVPWPGESAVCGDFAVEAVGEDGAVGGDGAVGEDGAVGGEAVSKGAGVRCLTRVSSTGGVFGFRSSGSRIEGSRAAASRRISSPGRQSGVLNKARAVGLEAESPGVGTGAVRGRDWPNLEDFAAESLSGGGPPFSFRGFAVS